MGQSKNVWHLYYTESIDYILDVYDDIEVDDRDKIEDLNKFKRQLENQGLMNSQLEEFIDNYIRFDNNWL